jgi:hypothetical protein
MAVGELFDAYGWRARLQPALLLLLPLLAAVALLVPDLYKTGTGMIGLATACGVTALLGHLARASGRRAQEGLYRAWGGPPTTLWLRRGSRLLDDETRARYLAFLEGHVAGWRTPTGEDEKADQAAADRRYSTAVKWLLEYTRDKARFPLVFKENVSYGFRRNLYGMKVLGIVVASISALVSGAALYHHFGAAGDLDASGSAAMVVSMAALASWLFIVNPAWVRDAADAYARALLSACEGVGAMIPRHQVQPAADAGRKRAPRLRRKRDVERGQVAGSRRT